MAKQSATKKAAAPKTGGKPAARKSSVKKNTVNKSAVPKSTAKKTAAGKAAPQKAAGARKTAKKTGRRTASAQTAQTINKAAREAEEQIYYQTKQATLGMEKKMAQTQAQYDKMTQQAGAIGKEQWEATIKSGTIWMKGCEDMMKTCMSMAQGAAERNSQAMKGLLNCRTLNDITEAQNKIAQQNFDDMMKGAKKVSEMSVKITTEALEPINDQFSKSVKKATESIAI